ncbi:MAG: tetratricopeptide repeat protein [Terriglobia bacterium]|jgi:tetratricopeptide (TPR) repeat protein
MGVSWKQTRAERLAAGALIVGVMALAAGLPLQGLAASPEASRAAAGHGNDSRRLAPITVDYPEDGSIFPPEITAPTFLWRDSGQGAKEWRIEVSFADGLPGIEVKARGERLSIGQIDPRCVATTNEPPKLTPQQAAARTWIPDAATWVAIKKRSTEHPATVTITGLGDKEQAVSRGQVTLQTSKDPVGAPIFYRDVPLMPSDLEKGVIKPLAPTAMHLIAWRLRNVGEPRSRLLLEGMHTCANCHSFSRDGKTLGMDLDGPGNDKGLYAIADIRPQMSIRNEDVISWASFRDAEPAAQMRLGFMSQVSPDGKYVVTTFRGSYYVVNFKDYRFLQVFYPTRGILAWYDRATGQRHPLPGADDPRYVQTDAVWSPDGKYIVFARAEARDPYPNSSKLAQRANDPEETQVQYDLYRIPFNSGQGGQPEPISGASHNGMSNTFPKVSPDGRWIVFVKCRNGQLMRPDSQLYVVPAEGGQARRLSANTPLMNSWHSFSPNGRWLVFSSKARSPYTQMYLTHLDEDGNSSPAILIENATAANRAVNIPEFVNVPPNGLARIDVPAAEFYRLYDVAKELDEKGQDEAAIAAWRKALALDPADAKAQYQLGLDLLKKGGLDEAIAHFQKAVDAKPEFALAQSNLGAALLQKGQAEEAVIHLQNAVDVNPRNGDAQLNFGAALLQKGRVEEAITHLRKAVEISPGNAGARLDLGNALYLQGRIPEALAEWREGLRADPRHLPLLSQTAWVLATSPEESVRNGAEAVELAQRAVKLSEGKDPTILDTLAAAYAELGRFPEAVDTARRALALATQPNAQSLAQEINARMALYEARSPFREVR